MTRRIGRRRFLGIAGAVGLGAVVAACQSGPSRADVDLGALRGIFTDLDGLDAIGRRALDAPGVGSDARAIERALRPDGAGPHWLQRTSAEALRRRLEQEISGDFERGRVVDVADWRLSLTEARVAALFHLAA